MKPAARFVNRNWRNLFILLAILVDSLAVVASGFVAFVIRRFLPELPEFPFTTFVLLVATIGAVLQGFAFVLGVYRSAFHSNVRRQYSIAAKAYVYGILVALALLYVLHSVNFPRRFVLLTLVFVPFAFAFGRVLLNVFNRSMQTKGFGIHRVLLAGYESDGKQVLSRFRVFPELGYDIRGMVIRKKHPTEPGIKSPIYTLSQVESVVDREKIDRIFVPNPQIIANGYRELMDVCRKKAVKLKVLSPDADELLRRASVYDIAGITLYAPPRTKIDTAKRLLKRSVDVVGSTLLILLLSPVFILTTLAILFESGRPVIFKQLRASVKGGRTFPFYKFRSMIKNADELKESLLEQNETDGALFKIKHDPRMTKVGRFIRKFSIDELPQLFNVVKGDMSLVGPRPLPVNDFERLHESAEYWRSIRDREKLKPGITGLWQVSGRSHIGFKEMILLDLYYVESYSFLFDLEILFATIPVVLFGRGSY